MTSERDDILSEKLDTMIDLLRHILAIELAREGVKKADIRKHLHVAKGTAVEMLKGIKTKD